MTALRRRPRRSRPAEARSQRHLRPRTLGQLSAHDPSVERAAPDGRRSFIVPADVSGRFTRRRRVVFAVLSPSTWRCRGSRSAGTRRCSSTSRTARFYLFGATFNAQDFWLAFFLLSGVGFALIVVTALLGPRLVRLGLPADGVSRGRLPPHRALDRGAAQPAR